MIASARAAHVARTAGRLGVLTGPVGVDFGAVRRRKDEMVARWQKGVRRRVEHAGKNLELVSGHARFVAPREVEAAGRRFSAKTIVINVGARPAVPDVAGLESVPWLDNRRVMELDSVPKHLVVPGGAVGCEFSAVPPLRLEVTILEHGEHLMHPEDPAAREIEAVFAAEEFVPSFPGSRRSLGRRRRGRSSGGRSGDRGSHLLVATAGARTPMTPAVQPASPSTNAASS
jgi:pyruvate/2-oxoglutarate dehydrogenase complex dihydrolipoamide dehydrogenase (E3) component